MSPAQSGIRVLALEPYYALSHRTFLEGYRRHSGHSVEIWSLPARKWKWRMRGAAYHFADLAKAADPGARPSLVLASDFLNLCDWHALAPRAYREAPSLLYFHENQITYPLGKEAPSDFHYGWINLGSAIAANRALFNSSFHREEFLAEARKVLDLMPDPVPPSLAERLRSRSLVFPVGIDFEQHRQVLARPRRANEAPVLIWNHRWEYDKGPDLLCEALCELKARGIPFRVVLCGQASGSVPAPLARLRDALGDRLLHMGYFEERRRYLEALHGADIVLSTARHEFFGVSIVEALFMGCLPVLPRALSYPEILPLELHGEFLYDAAGGAQALVERLEKTLERPPVERRGELMAAAARFDWKELAPGLDAIVEETVKEGRQ